MFVNCFRFAHPPRPASMFFVFCAKCESQAKKNMTISKRSNVAYPSPRCVLDHKVVVMK